MLGIRGFFRLTRLTFVKSEPLDGDMAAFYFKPARPIVHTAGQHSAFFLPGFTGVRIFSLASSPHEDHVIIATHVRKGSRYKQRLARLKVGESMWMIGPVLNFVLQPGVKKYVFLAQGIGITPFRSLLSWASHKKLDVQTTLIHVDKAEHPFRALTHSWADTSEYVSSVEEFQAEVVKAVDDEDAYFYLSGSPRFNKETKKLLAEQGVKGSRIKTDGFLGY